MEFDKLVALITEQVFNNMKKNTLIEKKILVLSKENNNELQELLGNDFDLDYYEDNINNDVVFNKEVQATEIIETKDSLNIRNKKLIAESDLRKIYMKGVRNVIIDKKSILTPLAKDFIRIYHLNMTRG